MRAWRVGHKSALEFGFPSGPYVSTGVDENATRRLWGMADAHSNDTHPSPYADPELRHMRSAERCGFDSVDALNAWFDDWTCALNASGFRVYVYDVPDWAARVGKFGQVVFAADEAVEVDAYDFAPEQLTLSN